MILEKKRSDELEVGKTYVFYYSGKMYMAKLEYGRDKKECFNLFKTKDGDIYSIFLGKQIYLVPSDNMIQ